MIRFIRVQCGQVGIDKWTNTYSTYDLENEELEVWLTRNGNDKFATEFCGIEIVERSEQ